MAAVGGMVAGNRRLREACEHDAAACAVSYPPYVSGTAISFKTQPPPAAEMAGRVADAVRTHAWIVLEEDDLVVGSAYGSPFRSRAASRWTCEVSTYLAQDWRHTGGGRAVYEQLFQELAQRGLRTAVAGMTLPNDASVGLHQAMGSERVGVLRGVGWEHGQWHDVAWMQRTIATYGRRS